MTEFEKGLLLGILQPELVPGEMLQVAVGGAERQAGQACGDALGAGYEFGPPLGDDVPVGMVGGGDLAAQFAEAGMLDEVVITRNSSPRSMSVGELGELATEVFGADRVHVEPHLVEAIDKAAALADEQGGVGGGVLATGSVVTAADVRAALGVTTT